MATSADVTVVGGSGAAAVKGTEAIGREEEKSCSSPAKEPESGAPGPSLPSQDSRASPSAAEKVADRLLRESASCSSCRSSAEEGSPERGGGARGQSAFFVLFWVCVCVGGGRGEKIEA